MKKLFYFVLLFFLIGCSTNEIEKGTFIVNKYDPSKPRVITGFSPTSGEIDDRFLIEGNFGDDISKMKVIFDGDREAVIISTDGTTIYGVVPKQSAGESSVTVVVDKDTITANETFYYNQMQRVSTITGQYRVEDYADGALYEARFHYLNGLAVVDGDNIIVVEANSNSSSNAVTEPRIRLVSPSENQVITLMTGYSFGKPAVNKERNRIYMVGTNESSSSRTTTPHIFTMEKGDGWVPSKLRGAIPESIIGSRSTSRTIWSCVLDNSEKYLYMRTNSGVFLRVHLEEYGSDGELRVETLLQETPSSSSVSQNYLVYHPLDDCFYASTASEHGIYKIYCDASGNWKQEVYAGFNRTGTTDGDRLTEAQFNQPCGMTVDSRGDLYIAEMYNYLIRKISRQDGQVTTIAGQYHLEQNIDGPPLEASFHMPLDIAVDSEDNFFIAEASGRCLRKLAIE